MKRLALLVAAVLAATTFAACSEKDETKEISIPILDTEEETYDLAEAAIEDISETYHVEASFDYPYQQTITFSQDGVVEEILVADNQEVKKGDVLCRLNTDEIQKELEESKIRLDAAQKTYDTLVNAGTSGSELEFAEIDLQIANAEYEKLQADIARYEVIAPSDGNIEITSFDGINPDIAERMDVSRGTVFGTMVDRSQKELCAYVYGDALNNVNFGSSVSITQGEIVDTKGKVTDIIYRDAGADYSGWMYVIEPEETDGFVDFGTIDVVFNVYEKKNVVTVPVEAVKEVSERKFVYVLVDGVKVETDVETGIENDDKMEITSGLSGGEEVIIR